MTMHPMQRRLTPLDIAGFDLTEFRRGGCAAQIAAFEAIPPDDRWNDTDAYDDAWTPDEDPRGDRPAKASVADFIAGQAAMGLLLRVKP